MKTIFTVLVIALVLLVGAVVIGPSLPEDNPIRVLGESITGVLSGMGSGFGGGYQPISP